MSMVVPVAWSARPLSKKATVGAMSSGIDEGLSHLGSGEARCHPRTL